MTELRDLRSQTQFVRAQLVQLMIQQGTIFRRTTSLALTAG